MPPIVPAYEWSQDAATITLSIPLKGTKAALVDLFAASTYVKVSFGRYLLELDLLRPIDDRAVKASARQGVLTVTLPKQEEAPWPSLTLEEDKKEDKQAIRERRAAAVAEHRATEQRRGEAARERRAELEQAAFRAQMAAQERARREAEARAAQEKREAEASILGGGAAAAPTPPLPLPPPKPAASVPFPRVMREATVRVRFTPRAFPTPARESKAAEEEDWLARNRSSSSSVLPKRDNEEGCEAHPVFLKAKGDELFKAGDFAGALNAYGACLAANPTHGGALANRAACHLKLGRWDDCVADCTRALGLLPEGSSSNSDSDKARVRLLARRGSANCEKGMYDEALEDYQAALRASLEGERDEALAQDVAKLQALVGSGAAGGAAPGGRGGEEQ